MNLLLDTHVLIWFTEGNDRLSVKARMAIEDPSNVKYLSVASLWEIVIKVSNEKLEINQSIKEVNDFLSVNNIRIIGIEIKYLNLLLNLAHHHGDPFDRLIISQAIADDLIIITVDKHFKSYPVNTLW